jgi:hypothetical protein
MKKVAFKFKEESKYKIFLKLSDNGVFYNRFFSPDRFIKTQIDPEKGKEKMRQNFQKAVAEGKLPPFEYAVLSLNNAPETWLEVYQKGVWSDYNTWKAEQVKPKIEKTFFRLQLKFTKHIQNVRIAQGLPVHALFYNCSEVTTIRGIKNIVLGHQGLEEALIWENIPAQKGQKPICKVDIRTGYSLIDLAEYKKQRYDTAQPI